MLDKNFQPGEVETRLYSMWEEKGAFKAGRANNEGNGAPFTIVIPPPNVTGSLHMGHALNNTVQDILTRFARMNGRDVLWQPGMDHAGIATQMVVERRLAENGEPSRREMGREAFVERVWQWKEESGGTIINQLKRLGASCDWSRERFTMDEGLSKAVLKVFVELYREGLIYKDKRLVNWDPKFLTAISDLEVVQKETKGHLWHFKYPIKDEAGRFITVATTRPETMLGDTAIAVHPDDERYKDLVGKFAVLPLVGREIVIVADNYADPEAGSGAVKITPAHDFNDFEVGRRHNLELINILDEHASLNDNVPEKYRGLDRFVARKLVVADIDALGLLEKIDDHDHTVPHGDRSDTVIEPWLTDQWYVDAETLAKPAITAVEDGSTKFVPKNWDKTYFEWMRNIQPWCISRQLWWGHQIPAWYGPDGDVFVGYDEAEALAEAESKYGKSVELKRDEDVLDTWFSSALWAFSTLGWPEDTPELEKYYPTNVLVTGFDIIFFWVARMMMMSLHFKKEIPFDTIYIHALVRDENGQKMSKSKGNVIDPLEIADKYGADALRFTLTAMAAQGRDIKLAMGRVEGYRNFATKLWNAARFAEMNDCNLVTDFDPKSARLVLSRWIAGELQETANKVGEGIESHRYNEAAAALYQFVWHKYCDWYLELAKPVFMGEDETAKSEARAMTAWVLEQILLLLHPIMPFITEELWQNMKGQGADNMLIQAPWPKLEGLEDEAAASEMNWVIELISNVRSTRAEMNVPAGARVPLVLVGADENVQKRCETHGNIIQRLARLSNLEISEDAPKGAIQIVVEGAIAALPLGDVIDFAEESARLEREIAKIDGEISKIEAKLANEKFTSRAPAHVVEEQKTRKIDAENTRVKLTAALARFAQ